MPVSNTSAFSRIDTLLSRSDRRLSEFLAAWRQARTDTAVPLKSDFDPLLIPALLRHVWIYRFDPDRNDFVCLLVGEEVNQAWRRNLKGDTLLELVGEDDHKTVFERWRHLIAVPAALIGSRDKAVSENDTWRAERMILPLRGATGAVDHLIGLSLYHHVAPVPNPEPSISDEVTVLPCAAL